jgi:hypothetical protein
MPFSPLEQRERIASACERDGLELVETLEELDVSGGASMTQRHGLRAAVDMVEAGAADVLVVAYFGRLVRSLMVQAEVVDRIEPSGARIPPQPELTRSLRMRVWPLATGSLDAKAKRVREALTAVDVGRGRGGIRSEVCAAIDS